MDRQECEWEIYKKQQRGSNGNHNSEYKDNNPLQWAPSGIASAYAEFNFKYPVLWSEWKCIY